MPDLMSHAQPARLAEPWDARMDGLPTDIKQVRAMRRLQQQDVEEAPTRLFSEDHSWETDQLIRKGQAQHRAQGGIVGKMDVMALYDEHVHDSRAWFMVAATGEREKYGSYFRYRTLLFGEANNKSYLKEEHLDAQCPSPLAAAPARAVGLSSGLHPQVPMRVGRFAVLRDQPTPQSLAERQSQGGARA